MAERRENSVLFSLRELRNIEEERVKGEEDAERARIEAERRAREEEIRRAKEAEEAKRRAEEERLRRIEEEKERQVREEQLRLQESERRAQIEAQTKLEQARIEAEARARMEAKKPPIGAIVGGVVGLVALAGGIMGYLVYSHNQEIKKEQARVAAVEAEKTRIAKEAKEREEAIAKELGDLKGQLEKATDEAEKAKIRARMESVASRASSGSRPKAAKAEGEKPAAKPKINTNTNDPLSGLGL